MSSLLKANNVTKIFGGGMFSKEQELIAVNDISLNIEVEKPRIIAIAGESGSGKTTLARLLLGLIDPNKGSVEYLGKNLQDMKGKEKRDFRRQVQPIFQDPYGSYNPFYKVDHVLYSPVKNFKLASKGEEAREMIEKALELVGLVPSETLGRLPHQLSGGQRQRVMVARALLLQPKIILADEPVSALDVSIQAQVINLMMDLQEEFNLTILFIAHDLSVVKHISTDIGVMYLGNLVEFGISDSIFSNPKHEYTKKLLSAIPYPDPKGRDKRKQERIK